MRVAHVSKAEARLRPTASRLLLGLLLFGLTTAAGLAAPGAPAIAAAVGDFELKGASVLIDGKPVIQMAEDAPITPTFNLDPRVPAEVEPNGTSATATPITLSGSGFAKIVGNIFANGDVDYYSFSGAAGDRIYAALMTSASSNGSFDSQLRLFASDGSTLVEFDDDDGSFGGFSSSIAGAALPAAGTYFLEVRHFSATNQLRPYDLFVQRRSGAPVAEVEPNDIPGTANPLGGGWISGARDPALATEQDWFSFSANAGDTVFLSLDLDPERDNVQWNGRLGIGLFGDADNQILTANDGSAGSVANPLSEALFITVKNTGTYFAFVDSATAATGGPTATYHLSVSVLPAPGGAGGSCSTYTSTNVPQVIPTGPGNITSTLTVPGNPRIADIDVAIQLNHTRMADLDVSLVAPGGNVVGLFTDIGASVVAGQAQMDTVFDDEAGIPPLFTVLRGINVRPELAYSLNWFDGQDAGGVWTLDLRDDSAAEGGNLTGWSITVCEPPPPPICPAGFTEQVVFSTDFETDAAGFTSSGTANEWERGLPSFAPITTCNSGSNCFATDLDNTYDSSSNQTLLSPAIDLANLSAPVVVRWAQKYQMENASFDLYSVTAQQVGGATPIRLFEWLGATMTNAVGNPTVTLQEAAGWGQYTARADALAGQNSELAFTVAGDSSVNFAGTAIDDVSVTACRALSADLSITKTNGTATSVPGTNTVYTIVASNAGGGDPVTGATVADTFPAACTSVSWTCVGSGGGSCPANGSGNINALVDLPAGGSATFSATCAIAASATGTLTNSATVTGTFGDPVPGNNISPDDIDTLTAQANLGAALTDSPDPVTAGGNLTYGVTVSNAGPSDAQTVTAGLPLPATTTFVSAVASSGGVCTNPGVGNNGAVNCTWAGATAPGTPRTVTVVAAVDIAAVGPLNTTLTVGSATTDLTPGNNTAPASTAVAPPSADVGVVLTDTPDPVTAGSALSYTATLTNGGPGIAQDVEATVSLQAGLGAATATPSGAGSCAILDVGGAATVNCIWAGPTASGASQSVTVSTSVPASASAGTLSATATADSSSIDNNAANDSAAASTTVQTSADVVLGFKASPTTVTPGLPITLAADAINDGPSDAQNVQISILLATGVQFFSATPSAGGVCTTPTLGSSGNVTCTWSGATAPGVARNLNVTAYSYLRGVASATASANAATSDPTPANNTAVTESVTVGSGVGSTPTLIPSTQPTVLAFLAMLLGVLGFAAVRRRM